MPAGLSSFDFSSPWIEWPVGSDAGNAGGGALTGAGLAVFDGTDGEGGAEEALPQAINTTRTNETQDIDHRGMA